MKNQAPWTPQQVLALNRWQEAGTVHPFTCGSGDRMDFAHVAYANRNGGDFGQLVATARGWICPACSYTQDWAHDFMLEPPPRSPFPAEGGAQ